MYPRSLSKAQLANRSGDEASGGGFNNALSRLRTLDFGLRDLRAKGATDEYRARRSLRELQHLLGHRSIRTTEIYLKGLVAETVRQNERPIVAAV